MNNTNNQVAEILLKLNAVTLNSKKPFRYASGILSPVYTDCRTIISYPQERSIIRDLYIEMITKSGEFDVIAGTATAGIPHAAFIADKMGLPMIYVRGKSKDHGKGNQIEGVIKKGQRVAIVEDLISTAESSIETARALKEAGALASDIFAITTYGMQKSIANLTEHKLKLHTMTTFTETVKTAEVLKMIDTSEKNTILDWINDPSGWGKKAGLE